MILPIVKYGDPVLRKKGAPVEVVTGEIQKFIEDMFDTMYSVEGIGLAAQQVGRAIQLTIIDVRAVKDRPSTLELNGTPANVQDFMPLVLINPVIKPYGASDTGPEGCLSFPEIYADVTRPGSVEVTALNKLGEPIEFVAGGLLSRAVQHEVDHLHGILFIDRMPLDTKRELHSELEALQAATKAALTKTRPK